MNKIPEELLSKILRRALSKGGDYADIYVEHERPLSIQLEDDKIEKLSSGVDAGIGVRVLFDFKSAYAYSNDFSESSLLAVADAVSRAAGNAGQSDMTMDLTRLRPSIDFEIKKNPRDVEMSDKIALMENANRAAKAVSSKIRQVSRTCRRPGDLR